MFFKKDGLIGLDVGSQVVKLIQVQETSTAIRLMNLGLAHIPRPPSGEKGPSRAEEVAQVIRQLTSNLKVKCKSTATSISGYYEVMIKKIELPMMTEEELEERMHVELAQYVPFNLEEVEVDYQILGAAKDRQNHMEVMLVAAKKESIRDCINLLRLAGLEPVVIDVDFFALSNAYEATYGLTGEESIVLLDIGATKATMNIIHQAVPIFPREIPIGGVEITSRIKDYLNVSFDQAERIKLGEIPQKVQLREVEGILAEVVQNWDVEFARALTFYHSNYPDNRIQKIFLSGGSCRIPGLDTALSESIGAPVEIFNPLLKLECDPSVFDAGYVDYVGPQMAISLGLALRRIPDK
jgi:type IV pilus assembly protein PilM